MQKIYQLGVFAACLLSIGSVVAVDMDNGVMVLTEGNFDEMLANHEHLLVEFYAPWCGHCKQLAPEYEGAAEILAKNDPPIALGKVDATVEKALGERFGIQGFPTLFWFKNGVKNEYTGGRTKETIVSWAMKKSGPPSNAVTCDDLKKKTDDANVKYLVAYFGAEDHVLYSEAHVPYASAEDKVQFVHAPLDCQEGHGLSGDNKIVFFRNFEDRMLTYKGEPDKDSLMKFIKPLMVPALFEFTEDYIEEVFGNQQNTTIFFRDPEQVKKTETFFWNYNETAKALRGKILFSYSGITDGIQAKLAEFMGVTQADLPCLRIIRPTDMKIFHSKFPVSGLTMYRIGAFVQEMVDGKLKPHLKSERTVDNKGNALHIIVGKNFEKITKNKSKDVLVIFHNPNCGHCKKYAPVWVELADHYKDNEDLIISKFDSIANEVEGVDIGHPPTLIFYPKNDKAGIRYDGEFELQSVKEWLAANSPILKEGSSDGHQAEL